jgi:hypothetical protein
MKTFKELRTELDENLSLWKHNSRSGMWDHQRKVTPETKDEWLRVHKEDEPKAHFQVSKNRPIAPPKVGGHYLSNV